MTASFKDDSLAAGIVERPRVFHCKKMSNREHEVAELVAEGLSNKEVAAELFVTEKTIKFHLTNIYKKLNVKTRAQLCVLKAKHQAGDSVIVPAIGVGLEIK